VNSSRREFLAGGISTVAASALAGAFAPGRALGRRIGAVAYAFDYALGLFGANAKRPGEKWDVFRFIEETRKAGGDVAQIFYASLRGMGEDELKRLRRLAADLDVALEVHGGTAARKDFDVAMRQAAALGSKVIGCSFGMMMRPDKIATLDAWDGFVGQSRARLRELANLARPLGLVVGVENHLDFGVEELRDLIVEIDSPHAGVMFDVGNTLGTLDDPSEAADLLGPLTVATHYKDFAVEETANGFRLTMVPLGCGSLNLPEITGRLEKHVGPDVHFTIEMMNGQQLEIPWLEDRFWIPFRPKPPREIAATLRHIRGQTIDRSEFKTVADLQPLSPDARIRLEQDRIARCISHLKRTVSQAAVSSS
jgi:sugar phosphate isomerase/epimerase